MTLSEAAEIVAGWMEPKPRRGDSEWWLEVSLLNGRIVPRDFTLDRLRGVEARLTDEQWGRYSRIIALSLDPEGWPMRARLWLHASAEQKLLALAEALKP